jgi:hypothetical protein
MRYAVSVRKKIKNVTGGMDRNPKNTANPLLNANNSNHKDPPLNRKKASYNKTSKSYVCDPRNFELILPSNHKPLSYVIGKKNNTYYKINIPKNTKAKAGSIIKFKHRELIKNLGQNSPNCDNKQILNIVNHIPTSGPNKGTRGKIRETFKRGVLTLRKSLSNASSIRKSLPSASSIRKSLPTAKGIMRGTRDGIHAVGSSIITGLVS